MINCLIKLCNQDIAVDIHIINDIPNVPTVLLGNTLRMAGIARKTFSRSFQQNQLG
jgi:hypothetical protein